MPQSKPIWFTELGCAAIDKGTNQPNKFVDPKSSESSLPKFSNGQRDDFLQIQYLKAMYGYWGDATHNPVSEVYGAPMIDMGNAYVWAWDTRPFPAFPNKQSLWSDGENHGRGHWLNGRVGVRTLASVVEEICHRSGVTAIDVSGLEGVVRGYSVDQVSDARSALQPLMVRHGFDAIERDGLLIFRMRRGAVQAELSLETLAVTEDLPNGLDLTRGAEAETSGRVRLRFLQAGGDHEVIAEEAVLPDEATHAVTTNELPLALTRAEGRQVVERWLTEARVSRDRVQFALPPSQIALGAGDVVSFPEAGARAPGLYRIDRMEQSFLQTAEAVRIEPEVYAPIETPEDLPRATAFAPPVPVLPLFLDLPLLTGDEVPHAPYLAATAQPWPGSVALYASATDENYALSDVFTARATIGLTENPLPAAPTGRWDEGAALQVKLKSGALESRSVEALLSGGNLAAIGDGSSGNWELIQFREAELIAPDTYLLRGRLRGQAGSDGLIPAAWPAGSWFVLFDGTPAQIELSSAQRRISRHYRVGPARRAVDDPSYKHLVEAFDGNGLRPYAPCHLRLTQSGGGDLALGWIRRTRIDGDAWDLAEVPLGEASEAYVVRVRQGASILREETVTAPAWSYSAAAQTSDGVAPGDTIEVAQVSERYGPGLFAAVPVPG